MIWIAVRATHELLGIFVLMAGLHLSDATSIDTVFSNALGEAAPL